MARRPRPKRARWPGTCANCGQDHPAGDRIVPLFAGQRSLECCPEEAP